MALRRSIIVGFGLSLCLWVGCLLSPTESDDSGSSGSDYTVSDIPDQTVRGMVGNRAWTFRSGKAERSYFDSTKLAVELYNSVVADPCALTSTGSDDQIFFSVPYQTGTYHLSFGSEESRTITFYDGATSMNSIAVEGILVIDSITASRVGVRFTATVDEENHAGGGCVVPLCAGS
jgi:hypothetical protein